MGGELAMARGPPGGGGPTGGKFAKVLACPLYAGMLACFAESTVVFLPTRYMIGFRISSPYPGSVGRLGRPGRQGGNGQCVSRKGRRRR